MASCWTQEDCNRALLVSHGGAWTLEYPYDSFPAFQRAWAEGTNAVKGDYRVSLDGHGVVVHSSPLHVYESFNCDGKRVEDMTLAEIERCQMELTHYTFISVRTLLDWANSKVICMFDVKRPQDIPHAIQTILRAGAENRTFLEVSPDNIIKIATNSTGWERVYYLANSVSMTDVATMIRSWATSLARRPWCFEFDPKFWAALVKNGTAASVVSHLHAAGLKTLTATPTQLMPSVAEQMQLFSAGIDFVYSYDTKNGVIARDTINKQRGLPPRARNA